VRFYIDEDIDHRIVRAALLRMGHELWSTKQAARTGDSDASQLAYAIDHDAVVITHNRDFTRPHRDRPIGRVILLRCLQPQAAAALEQVLDGLVPMLERTSDVYVEVKQDSRGRCRAELTFGTELR